MSSRYHVPQYLSQHKAQLKDSVDLDDGIALAHWYNDDDFIELERAEHHTLSLYVADGYQSYRKTGAGWHNGGAPDRFCLMPGQHESTWDIRGPLEFVHLYFTDAHLRTLAEQVWDKSPAGLLLEERTFAEDERIKALYRQFLLACDWRDNSERLALSSAVTLLLTQLLKGYTQYRWQAPVVRGGLAPAQLRRVKDYIEAHLDQPLPLRVLAGEACLSEYHFARMFRQSEGLPPHQYVLARRLLRAEQLLRHSALPLTEVALACGFSSASHLTHRFRQSRGLAPSALRDGAAGRPACKKLSR